MDPVMPGRSDAALLASAASAMSGVAPPSGDSLPIWIAALLFAGYALLVAEAGARVVIRRDIT
jgi:hypothetical protein